jgi:hypothetical protein
MVYQKFINTLATLALSLFGAALLQGWESKSDEGTK